MSGLPDLSVDELAVIYSAVILADDDVSITVDKISTLLKAANVDVEPIWPALYTRALSGLNVRQLLTSTVTSSTGPSSAASAPALPGAGAALVGGAAQTAEPAKTAETAPAQQDGDAEDDDEDLGMNLFDFD